METSSGIMIGKIAFYVALAALIAVIIVKKIKQTKDAKRDDNPPNT